MSQGRFYLVRSQSHLDAAISSIRAALESKPDYPVSIKLDKYKSRSTSPQIRYAHKLIDIFAAAKARDSDDIKKQTKAKFGIVVVSTNEVTGGRWATLTSFTQYTPVEMSSYIYQVEVMLAEHAINFDREVFND